MTIDKIIKLTDKIKTTKSTLFTLYNNGLNNTEIFDLLKTKYDELNNLLEELINIDITDNIFKINEIENRFNEIMEKNK